MKASFFLAVVVSGVFGFAGSAAADQAECPISQIGQPCGAAGSTCIDATCCDDPNGCAYDAGPVGSSGGGSSSSGGGSTGTGVSRACAVCEFIGETYCPPADIGKACPGDAGLCGWSGGGGGPATSLDGGTTSVGFSFSACGSQDFGDDGGGSGSGGTSSSGGSGGGGGSSSGSGGFGSSSSGSSGSSGASSSSSSGSSGGTGSSGAGGASGDAGADGNTVTAHCGISPTAPHGGPWGIGAGMALGLAAIARRRRSAR